VNAACGGFLIAGTLVQNGINDGDIDTLGSTVQPNTEKKAVLLYDTEQSENQLYKNIANILRRSDNTSMPDFFKAYCLTSMSRKERMQAIVQSMDKFYYQYGGIQLVVIDGIADLVRCANDECERAYSQKLHSLYAREGYYPQRPFSRELFYNRSLLKRQHYVYREYHPSGV
jgi:hypothetical protein